MLLHYLDGALKILLRKTKRRVEFNIKIVGASIVAGLQKDRNGAILMS